MEKDQRVLFVIVVILVLAMGCLMKKKVSTIWVFNTTEEEIKNISINDSGDIYMIQSLGPGKGEMVDIEAKSRESIEISWERGGGQIQQKGFGYTTTNDPSIYYFAIGENSVGTVWNEEFSIRE